MMEDGGSVVLLTAGIALVVVGLAAWLHHTHLRRLRAWDRPAWLLHPAAPASYTAVRCAAVVAGWTLMALASPWLAGLTAAAIAAAWALRVWVRSERYVARRLRADLTALRRREPRRPERELLARLVLARHPEWGPELVDRIVADHPDTGSLARVLARMERGR